MAFRLPRLPRGSAITDGTGLPTALFQRWWQSVVEQLEGAVTGLTDSVAAIAAAQAAADAANAAAATANAATDAANASNALTGSYVTGLTLTATDAGSDVTITISAHTRVYGDGSSVAVSGGSITGQAYSTTLYLYYDDALRAGGAVTFVATTSSTTAAQTGIRHTVGAVETPAALGSPTGGSGVSPPGVGNIEPLP